MTVDQHTKTEIEAQVFRRLVDHLRNHNEVQNIDLMILASFCRNCLSKWYRSAAEERNIELSYDEARELIYGMPYDEWKLANQTEATPEQMAAYEEKHKK